MKLSPIAKHYHESRNKDVNEGADQSTLIKGSAYSAYQLNKPALALKIIAAKNVRDGDIRKDAGLCTKRHYRLKEQFRLGWAKEIKAENAVIQDPGAPSTPVFDRASYPFLNAVQRGGPSEINSAQPPGGPGPGEADAPEQPPESLENPPHNQNPHTVVAPEPTPPRPPPPSPSSRAPSPSSSEGRAGLNFGGDPKTAEASPPSSPTPSASSPVFKQKNAAASDSSGEGESEKGTDSHRKSRGSSGASSHSGSIKLDDSEGSAPATPTWPPAPSAFPSLPVGGGGGDRGASGRGSPSSGDKRNPQPFQPFQPRRPRQPRPSHQDRVTLPKEFVSMTKTELDKAFDDQYGDYKYDQVKSKYDDFLERTKRGSPDDKFKAKRVEQTFIIWAAAKGFKL